MSPSASSASLPGYAVHADGYDEAVAASGETRPAWRTLSRAIALMSPSDVAARQRQADRLVESEGASYLFHDVDGDSSRPWRLDPLPLVLSGSEWAQLEHGIAQRVRVLERMTADLYGGQQLLRNGVVPPTAVFGAAEYVHASHGGQPVQGRWLTTYAADLVRLADGTWHVLRDLTDAPSGTGYALVNRSVSAQLLPGVVREMAPLSLTPFFADTRSALDSIAPADRPNARTVVLSPGVGHPSYFEHSYLAAHLGYHLAETGDLVVRNGRVWLRALSGLEQIDVLLRRVDGVVLDPLETSGRAIGVPGLARCARNGGVGLANALGAGLAGSLTLLPYVPAAAAAFGEQVTLPTLHTLWCGATESRDEVLSGLSRYVLHDTAGIGVPGSHQAATVFGSQLDAASAAMWRALIAAEPHRVVAQAKATFATAPVLTGEGVLPATVVLRVLAVVGKHGVSVMPGGLARVMNPLIPVVNQTSGFAKDVWVLDDRAERPLPIATRVARSMPQVDLRESLPTRAAEAMYWVGRNAERSEAVARATASALTMVQADPSLLTAFDGGWRRPVVNALVGLTQRRHDDGTAATGMTPDDAFRQAVTSALVDSTGLPGALDGLTRAAGSARQFLSAMTWRVLGELGSERAHLGVDVASAYDPGVRRRLDTVLVHLSSLSGLFNESTVRGPAWRFLEIGRRVDRALGLLTMFEAVVSPASAQLRDSLFDYVLAANESLVAYRRRYRSDAVLDALVDLLVLDDANPRSLAFQLDQLRTQLALLPPRDGSSQLAEHVERASAALIEMSWLSAEADQPGSDGRREVVDRFVLAARNPLVDLGRQINVVYFNDPARLRQRFGGS